MVREPSSSDACSCGGFRDVTGVFAMWLLQLTLLLFIPATLLVYSFVEPLEAHED
jgi:hypothetical protein